MPENIAICDWWRVMRTMTVGAHRAVPSRWRQRICGFIVLLSCFCPIASCRSLDGALCAKCESECPDDLVCDPTIDRCVASEGDPCDLGDDEGSSDGVLFSGNDSGDTSAGEDVGGSGAMDGAASGRAGTGNGGAAGADGPGPSTSGSVGGNPSSGGSAGSSSPGAGGTGARCLPDSHACVPRITTSTVLDPVCVGATIEIQLEAVCDCDPSEGAYRSFHWVGSEVPGLEVSPGGLLEGIPLAGLNEIEVTVFAEEGGVSSHETFTLSVAERCLVLFASEEASAGHSHVVASRLDNGIAQQVPRQLGEGADVISFNLSSDGRFLAQIEELEAQQRLFLFDLLGNEVRSLALESTGDYRAHAFSPDSRWLALVTADPADPLARSLDLIDLSADPPLLLDSTDSAYLAGLTWADDERLLLVGEMSAYAYLAVVKTFWVEPGGWSSPLEYDESANVLEVDPFGGLFVNSRGFFVLYSLANCFWNDADGRCWSFSNLALMSPNIAWGLAYSGEGARIDPLGDFVGADAYSSVDDCLDAVAWSEDGSTLLCRDDQQPIVYQVGSEERLNGTEFELSEPMLGPPRAAFSRSGNWLAFTPTNDGLVIVSAAEFSTASLDDTTLARPDGDNEWDFFFTTDERMLVIQRGSSLMLADLPEPADEFRFSTVAPAAGDGDVVLPAVPVCESEGLPKPERWCGAPRFQGNIVASRDDAYLGFPDADGVVHTVALRDAPYQALPHGAVAPSCADRCIQFR